MARTVVLERHSKRRIEDETMKQHIASIVKRSLTGPRGTAWECKKRAAKPKQDNGEWHYKWELTFNKVRGRNDPELAERQWQGIYDHLLKAAGRSQYRDTPFYVDGKNTRDTKDTPAVPADAEKNYGAIPADRLEDDFSEQFFRDIYDRDAQIEIIKSAVRLAVNTDLQKRYHCLLYGPPGCGKTDIMTGIGNMVGEGNYMMLDATTMTQAGVLELLMTAEVLPPLLLIEEIEKVDDAMLRWLLGILDARGRIQRTNFRVGNQMRNVRMLCVATVNDIKGFKSVMSGALASRFSHKLYCPRPSKEIMKRILERELRSIAGDPAWASKTIDFCMGELQMDDPRQIIPICMCGGENLMDGSYQDVVRMVQPTAEMKKEDMIL